MSPLVLGTFRMRYTPAGVSEVNLQQKKTNKIYTVCKKVNVIIIRHLPKYRIRPSAKIKSYFTEKNYLLILINCLFVFNL